MKTSFWTRLMVIALSACMLLSAPAIAEARYPVQGDVLTDDATALSQTMTSDIAAYAARLESDTGLTLHVALVLFLDGETAQTYADTLFTRWSLGKEDLLLLGATAEDAFALATGAGVKAKLSDASLRSLAYVSGFSDAFKAQRYDEALGAFFVSFHDLVKKQYGATFALGELFKAYQPSAHTDAAAQTSQNAGTAVSDAIQTVVDTTSSIWTSTMDSITNNVENYQAGDRQRDESDRSLTPTGWIVLAVIALIIFGQSNRARRARWRNGGCGCSPIGWIIGGLGLGALFGRRDGESRRGPGGFGRPPRW